MSNLGWRTPRLAATERPTPGDFRWAAGFFEGEGTVGNHLGCVCANVGQKNLWPLERMKALFGGHISIRKDKDRAYAQWAISGARARGFLMSIYGLLSPRRQDQIRSKL